MRAARNAWTARNRFVRNLALIVVGALILRVAYTLALSREANGLVAGDFTYFHQLANLLADGHGHILPSAFSRGEVRATAEHPPLWTLLLASASKLGGNGELAHRLVGAVVGTGTVAAIGLLGRRAGGDRVGLLAAGIAAVHPILIAADGSLMSETLYGFWVALAMLAAYHFLDEPTSIRGVALGVPIGLAALTRGEGLLLLFFLALPVAWIASRRRAAHAAAIFAAALLVVTPWLARNWITFDRPVLTSTNDSTVLIGANCSATYHGIDTGFWRASCLTPASSENEAEIAATWRREGLNYARDHLGRLVVVAPIRVLRTWGFWQPGRQVLFAEGRNMDVERVGTGFYFALLPLAIYGAVLLRRRKRPVVILLAPVGIVMVTTILAYGYTRFRFAAEISLAVLAAVAVSQLADRVRQGRRRPALDA
jgi:4-amino-4-deoxy-L-arabinose transferase-like glycosyltransferase